MCYCQSSSSTFTAFCSLHRLNCIFTKEIQTPGNSGPPRGPTNAQQLIRPFLSSLSSPRKVTLRPWAPHCWHPPQPPSKQQKFLPSHFHAQAFFWLTLVHLPEMLRNLPCLNSWPALAYSVYFLSLTFQKRSYCSLDHSSSTSILALDLPSHQSHNVWHCWGLTNW